MNQRLDKRAQVFYCLLLSLNLTKECSPMFIEFPQPDKLINIDIIDRIEIQTVR
jgi:hypothetical protein